MEDDFDLLDGDEGGVATEETPAEPNPAVPSVGEIEAKALLNPNEWASTLEDTLKNEPSLHKFKDVNSLAKSYMELEKSRGKSPFPGPKSTEEERIAFYRKAGVPDPKEYSLDHKTFGLDDKVAEELKDLASKNGIAPHALAETLKFIQGKHSKTMEDGQAQLKAQWNDQVAAIKTEYGTAFDKYKNLAKEVAKEVYSPEQLKHIQESGLAKEPMFVKLLMDRAKYKYGEEMIDDDHTSKGVVATPAAIETRIGEIMSDKDYFDPQASRHNSLVQELEKLYLAKNKI